VVGEYYKVILLDSRLMKGLRRERLGWHFPTTRRNPIS
jgi:hypothetical protein